MRGTKEVPYSAEAEAAGMVLGARPSSGLAEQKGLAAVPVADSKDPFDALPIGSVFFEYAPIHPSLAPLAQSECWWTAALLPVRVCPQDAH